MASAQGKGIYFAGFGFSGGLLFLAGVVFAGSRRSRKAFMLLLLVTVLMTGTILVSCGGGGGGGEEAPASDEKSYTVSGLISGTSYYWQVVADDGKGGTTPSEVRSFGTQ